MSRRVLFTQAHIVHLSTYPRNTLKFKPATAREGLGQQTGERSKIHVLRPDTHLLKYQTIQMPSSLQE